MVKLKSVLGKKSDSPREPRKKVELQIRSVYKQFSQQVELLERALENPNLPLEIKETGTNLFTSASRFQELQIAQINNSRLQSLSSSLISPLDFSLWVKNELIIQTELIYHYLSTVGDF